MRPILTLGAAVAAAFALAACNQELGPQGKTTAAAMPDTDAAAATGSPTAPDAGATGTVPADGSPPPMQPTTPAAQGAGVGTSGGQGAGSGNTATAP